MHIQWRGDSFRRFSSYNSETRWRWKSPRRHNSTGESGRWTVLVRIIADTEADFEDSWKHGAPTKSHAGTSVTSRCSQAQIHPDSRQAQLWCLWDTETSSWANRESLTHLLCVQRRCRTWPVLLKHIRKAHFVYHSREKPWGTDTETMVALIRKASHPCCRSAVQFVLRYFRDKSGKRRDETSEVTSLENIVEEWQDRTCGQGLEGRRVQDEARRFEAQTWRTAILWFKSERQKSKTADTVPTNVFSTRTPLRWKMLFWSVEGQT